MHYKFLDVAGQHAIVCEDHMGTLLDAWRGGRLPPERLHVRVEQAPFVLVRVVCVMRETGCRRKLYGSSLATMVHHHIAPTTISSAGS